MTALVSIRCAFLAEPQLDLEHEPFEGYGSGDTLRLSVCDPGSDTEGVASLTLDLERAEQLAQHLVAWAARQRWASGWVGVARFDVERAELLVRLRGPITSAPLGPKPTDHPTIGVPCPVCGEPLLAGQLTSAVALGVATPRDEQALYRGEAYDAVAAEVHTRCAGRSR